MPTPSRPLRQNNGPLSGVCVALLVPRTPRHAIDMPAMQALLAFHLQRGTRAFALNGATGEYVRSSHAEVETLLRLVASTLNATDTLLLGVGAPDTPQTQRLLDLGSQFPVSGYLVPVPHFFPLQQPDIQSFVQSLHLPGPAYLYNLPSFTTPIHPATAQMLCQAHGRIVGVKDSSGSLDIVRLLSRNTPNAARIIGSDGALFAAVQQQLCDGVVSGVACVLPELIHRLYTTASTNPYGADTITLNETLLEYIEWLGKFPVPWGLKLTAQFRGLFQAEFGIPLTAERRTLAADFHAWFHRNRERLFIDQEILP